MIIQREYLSRVKKKTFIITTILAPIGFVIFWIALIFIMTSGAETQKMALLDPDGVLQLEQYGKLRDGLVMFKYPKQDLETLKENFEDKGYDGIVTIPRQVLDSLTTNFKVEFYANKDIGITTQGLIENAIVRHAKKIKMKEMNISAIALKRLDTNVEVLPHNLKDKKQEEASTYKSKIAYGVGMAMMMLIYMVIFIYGNMVMRSVMEEKTNRIVEVLISSVKPFQLMLGKIVGVGAVGLTQFAIWALTIPLLYMGVGFAFSGKLMALEQTMNTSTQQPTGDVDEIMMVFNEIWNFEWGYILGLFLVFFFLGYVLYASLYAAVGAAMGDDWGEGQSLTLIVVLPVLIAFYLGMAAVNNPASSLAFWSSVFPFFAPIVMPARLIFDPPLWEVLLSIGVLIFTALLFIWVSGRIYRIGILMYGKKTTFKDFVQWMFRKD